MMALTLRNTPIEVYHENTLIEPPSTGGQEPPSSKLQEDVTGLAALSLGGEDKTAFWNLANPNPTGKYSF